MFPWKHGNYHITPCRGRLSLPFDLRPNRRSIGELQARIAAIKMNILYFRRILFFQKEELEVIQACFRFSRERMSSQVLLVCHFNELAAWVLRKIRVR